MTVVGLLLGVSPFVVLAQTSCPNLYRNLSFGSRGQDVVELQTFLITQGDLSAGLNTGYFGRFTREAVRKFQCREMQICSGSEASNGYGSVGPRTRAKIASVCDAGGVTVSANFTAYPLSGPAPLNTVFSSTIGGDGYVVDFGDGQVGTLWAAQCATCALSAYHTYTLAGTYTAKLKKMRPFACDAYLSNPPHGYTCNPYEVVGTVTITVAAQVVNSIMPQACSVSMMDQLPCQGIRQAATRDANDCVTSWRCIPQPLTEHGHTTLVLPSIHPEDAICAGPSVSITDPNNSLALLSKKALLNLGISESYLNSHFKFLCAAGASFNLVRWQYTIGEYTALLEDYLNFIPQPASGFSNQLHALTEIQTVISKSEAERIMNACIGDFTDAKVVLGYPFDSFSSMTFNPQTDYSRPLLTARPVQVVSNAIGDTSFSTGTVDLMTGVCTKGSGGAIHQPL